MPSLKNTILGLIFVLIVGIVGAIPFAILGLIFGGVDAARDLFILESVLLASWFPLKFLIDSQVKGQVNFALPNISLNQLSLFIVMIAAVPIVFFLYFFTIMPFLVGALLYGLTGAGVAFALIAAIIVQSINIYRSAQREKTMGVNNQVFMRVRDFSTADFDFQLDPDTMRGQTPREDEPPILYLPEDNLRERSDDSAADEAPMTITLDPDVLSEQSDDEA